MMISVIIKKGFFMAVKAIARRIVPVVSAAIQTIARRHIQVAASTASLLSTSVSRTLPFTSPESDF
jgi:hypothetical protein